MANLLERTDTFGYLDLRPVHYEVKGLNRETGYWKTIINVQVNYRIVEDVRLSLIRWMFPRFQAIDARHSIQDARIRAYNIARTAMPLPEHQSVRIVEHNDSPKLGHLVGATVWQDGKWDQ